MEGGSLSIKILPSMPSMTGSGFLPQYLNEVGLPSEASSWSGTIATLIWSTVTVCQDPRRSSLDPDHTQVTSALGSLGSSAQRDISHQRRS